MSRAVEVCATVLPVLLVLAIGMFSRRKNLLSAEGIGALKSVVINFTLPAVLIGTFAKADYALSDLLIPVSVFLICLLALLLGRLANRVFRMNSLFVPYLMSGFEVGMLGYALVEMLYGTEKISDLARLDLGHVLFVFTLYKIWLSIESGGSADPGKIAKELFTSPIILAIVAGVLIGATGLYDAMAASGLHTVLDACTNFLAAPTSAIILLTIGYDLVFADVPWKKTMQAVALRFAIMMVLRVVLLSVLRVMLPETDLTAAATVMFILPPPYVLPVFADDPDQRVYLSSVLSVSTLVTVIGFAFLAVIG